MAAAKRGRLEWLAEPDYERRDPELAGQTEGGEPRPADSWQRLASRLSRSHAAALRIVRERDGCGDEQPSGGTAANAGRLLAVLLTPLFMY
jgi:hypothetical protein